MELSVCAYRGEGLLFDRRGAQLDSLEHAWVQDIDTGIDAIAHELDGFLHETVDAGRVVGFVHHDAVFGGFFDFGDDDGALVAVGFVELGELLKGVVADDV